MAEPREFYDENEDQPQVIVQKKGGFLGKFIALLLGLILGIASAFGGVAAIAYFVPIKDGINTVGNLTNTDINYKDFITEEYGDKSIVEAITSLSKLAQKGDGLTFNDLNSVSPQVEKAIENLVESAGKNSIKLDKTELMSTPLKDFPDLLIEEIEDIELGEILMKVDKGIYSSEAGPILKELFFGQENVNYKDNGDGTLSMLPLTYTFENNTFACVDGTEYTFTTTDLWTAKSGEYIKPYTGEGSYLYAVYEKDDTLLYALGANTAARSSSAVYTAYAFDNNTQAWETALQASLKLGAFMDKDANPIEVIGNVRLGTLLGITTEEEAKDDKNALLVTLAYGTFGVDYEFVDGKIMPVNGKEFITLTSLITDSEEVLDTIELGALLNIKTKADAEKSENKMLVALAYGTYGRDFVYSGTADDSAIVPPDGKERAFTTIGDLIGEPEAVLDTIELGALLGVNTKEAVENPDNSMLVALAYGTQDVDFEIINGYVSPIGDKEFLTLGSLISNPDDALNTVQLGALLGIKTKGDVDKNSTMAALAYGKYGVDYEYEPVADFNKDGKIDKDDEPFRKIKAIETGTPFLTLGKLITESGDVLENIELGALVGITNESHINDSNKMLVALAYGTQDIDYYFDTDGTIKHKDGGKEFVTIGKLMNEPNTVLETVQLGALVGITNKADITADNEMLVVLAYGTEGVDYYFDTDGTIKYKDGGKEFTTLGGLMNEPNKVLESVELGALVGITTKGDITKDNEMLVVLAYGTENVDYTFEPVADFNGDGNIDDKDEPFRKIIPVSERNFTTLDDLMNKPNEVLEEVQLGALLGITNKTDITADNEMLVVLAYGTEGVDYYFDTDGTIKHKDGGKEFTTLGGLMNKPNEILETVQLGALVGITNKADITADNEMLVVLAYGTEGVDYYFDTDGSIKHKDGGKEFTTLGGLMNKPNEILETVQLGALLGITNKADITDENEMLVVLAYGTEGVDYYFDTDGTIKHKDGGKEFTTLGGLMNKPNEVLESVELGALVGITTKGDITEDNEMLVVLAYGAENVDYTFEPVADFNNDGNIDDKDEPFRKIIPVGERNFTTLDDLMNKPNEVLEDVQLGALLGITNKADITADNEMLVVLAYGTEGVDYYFDTDGTIKPQAGGKEFTTLGGLMNKPNEILESVELGALVGITNKDDITADNEMLVVLAYGTEGVDYKFDADGKIVPFVDGAERNFTTLGQLMNKPNEVLESVELGALVGITTKDDITADNEMLVVLAYGTENVDYTFDADGKIIPVNGEERNFTTLKQLMETPNDVLEDVELGALLGITTKEDVTGNEMLVAIAYGTEGEDYTFDADGKIIPVGERNFTTVGQLMTNSDDVLNSLQLGTLLGINTEEAAKKDSNAMYVALAYGKYGTDYDFVDGYVHQIETGRKFTTLGDLMKDPQNTFNEIELGVLLGVNKRKEAENSKFAMYVALAYGTYGIDYEFDGDGDDAQVIPIGDKKFVTVGDLIKNPENTINDIELGVLLGVNKKDVATKDGNEMFTALCYGTEGVDYYFNDDGYIVSYYDETTNPNVKKPTTIKDLIEKPQDALNDIQLGSLLQITTKGDTANNDMIVALAYGEYGKDYTFAAAVDADNDKTISSEEDAARKIIPAGLPESKPFTTLGDLISNPNDTLQSIQLGSILGLKTRAQIENADPVIVSLAFGSENVDYEFTAGDDGVLNTDDDLISELREGAFTTLAQLMDEQKASELFTQIELSAVFMADVLDPESDHLSSALAFGHDGEHYYLKRNADGTLYTEEIELEDGSKATRYAFAEDGTYTLENGTVITVKNGWIVKDAATGETYAPRTVADLRGGDISEIIDGLLVSDVFNTDQANAPQLLKKIGDWKISDLANEEKFKTLQIKDLLEITDTEGILYEMGEWSIGEINTDKINTLTLKSVLNVQDGDTGLLATLANKTKLVDGVEQPWTVADLTEENIKTLQVKDLLTISDTDNGILSEIGEWTISDLETSSKFDEITLKSVLDPDDTATGVVKILANKKDSNGKLWTLGHLKDSNYINTLTVGELIEINDNATGLLAEIKGWTLNDLKAGNFDSITLKSVLDPDGTAEGVVATLANKKDSEGNPWTLGHLKDSNYINTLTVGELIEIDDSAKGLLAEIKGWTLNDLKAGDFDSITLKSVLDPDGTASGVVATLANKKDSEGNPWTLGHLKNSDNINTLTVGELIEINDNATGLLAEIKGWTLNDLKAGNFDSITLKSVLDPDGTASGVVKVLANKTHANGEHWTLGDLKTDDSLINSLTVGELLSITATEGILSKIKDWTLNDLKDESTFDELQLKDVIDVGTSGMLSEMGEWKIGEIDEAKIKTLTLKNVLNVQDGETGLLATLANKTKTVDGVEQPWTIADLTQDNIKTLKIKELINITDTKGILYEMGEWTLDELNQDKIKTLKLKDIIDVGTSGMLYEMGNWTLNEINEDKIKTLTLKNVLNVQDGETGLLATLANKTKMVEGVEQPWTIADLTNENIKSLTLGEVVPDATAGDPSTNLLAALKDTKISELDANYVKDHLKVGQVLGVKSTDTGMLAKFADIKISEFTEEKLKSELKLKDVVTVDHPVMKALSEYTLKELSENNTTILNNITIGTAIGLTKNDAGVWVDEAGTPVDAILAAMAAISLGELDNDGTIKNTINGLKIGDVISVDPYEKNSSGEYILDSEGKKVVKKGVLEYLVSKEYTIAQLSDQNTINNIPLAQIIDIDSDNAVLSALKKNNATLSNLPEIIENLSLIEILGEDNMKDNFFLQHVMGDDVTISNIGTKIDTITIVDLFKNSIEYKPVYERDSNGDIIYDTVIVNGTETKVARVVYETDSNGDYILDSNGKKIVKYEYEMVTDSQGNSREVRVLTGTWKYLLTYPKSGTTYDYKAYYEYTAKDMEALMANMTQNIEDANLRDLYADGIAPHLNEDTLNSKILYKIIVRSYEIAEIDISSLGITIVDEDEDGLLDNYTIGDLSVPQLSIYLDLMIDALYKASRVSA